MAYTTETEIENYLLTTIDSSFSSQISSWISAVEKWINNYTDRTFEAVTATRKFDGKAKEFLMVDDLLSVDTIWFVSNDSTSDANTDTLATTDYYLYQNDDPNKTPYNKVVLNPDGSYQTFEWGYQNIWIKGSWGYTSTVPGDIKMVATKLTGAIINTGKDGNVKSFSEGDYQVTFDNIINRDLSIKQVLDWYKRPSKIGGFQVTRI